MSDILSTLKQARIDSGMSIRDLATESGVHYNTIYRMENGLNSPGLDAVESIAKSLGYKIQIKKGHKL